MSDNLTKTVSDIDIHGDKLPDISLGERTLKNVLAEDLQTLHKRKTEWKITESEYDWYVITAKSIFEKQGTELSAIEKEYTEAKMNIFRKSNSLLEDLSFHVSEIADYWEKKGTRFWKLVRNVATDALVMKEQFLSENLLAWYTSEKWNYTLSVKEFESKLQTDDINQINTKEFSSYLHYLLKKWQLNKDIIKNKMSPENLQKFPDLWNDKLFKTYTFFDGGREENDITLTKEIKNFFSGDKKKINKLLSEIFCEMLGKDEIQIAQRIYKDAQKSKYLYFKGFKKRGNEIDKESQRYNYLIDKAYDVFGNGTDKKEFHKKFDKLLKNWFSAYEASYEFIGGSTNVGKFQKLMRDISDIEKKEAQNIGNQIQQYTTENLFKYGKNFDKLPFNEKLKLAERNNDQELIDALKEQSKHKMDSERARTLETSDTATLTALNYAKNWKSLEKINKTLDITTKIRNTETGINISTIQSIPWLKDVTDMSQVWKDPKKVELLTTYLKNKPHPTEEEKNILALIPLKKEQMREFIMASKNISEREYADLKKTGKIQDFVFAENLIGSIESNITLSQLDKKLDIAINDKVFTSLEKEEKYANTMKKNNIESILTSLSDNGEKVFLQKIGNDTCFVTKNDGKYVLSINGKTEICSTQEEVNNTINTYDFFHDMGLKSLIPFMKPFLASVKNTNSICPKFDIQKGILPWEQKNTLLRAVDTIFNLDMKEKIVATGTETLVSKFEERLNAIDQKARLRGKWILTAQGGFSREQLNQVLMMKKEVL